MNDKKKDIWNDDDEEETPKKGHPLRGAAIFAVTLIAVLAVVVFAAYRDGTGFDVLRRYFNYGRAESAGGAAVYHYDASSSNCFAALGEKLVVLSDTSLTLLDPQGGEVWSRNVKMSAPALHSGGGRVVAYDVGGTELYVIDEKGTLLTIEDGEWEPPLISATLNEKGWLAVTSDLDNYKGCVSVYNSALEQVFAFWSSRRFVSDAYVTDDCTHLAAVTLGQEESVFVSNIVLYDLTKKDPVADYDIADGLVMAVGQDEDRLITVSDTVLTFAGTDGTVEASYPYGGAYLREYDLEGDGFTALLLNRYSSGSVGRIVTVSGKGEEIASLDVNEEVLNISAAGRYLAVLYASRLVVYNPDLQVYASLSGTDYAKEVLMRSDGSALLAGSETAKLFLP